MSYEQEHIKKRKNWRIIQAENLPVVYLATKKTNKLNINPGRKFQEYWVDNVIMLTRFQWTGVAELYPEWFQKPVRIPRTVYTGIYNKYYIWKVRCFEKNFIKSEVKLYYLDRHNNSVFIELLWLIKIP